MSEKLTFGDLKAGDRFISFPVDGDNSGHGGYLGSYNIFTKLWKPVYEKSSYDIFKDGIENHPALQCNAVDELGRVSHQPDIMPVIKLTNFGGNIDLVQLRQLASDWRATSNVMSEADGDGPVRSSLRHCATGVEKCLPPK